MELSKLEDMHFVSATNYHVVTMYIQNIDSVIDVGTSIVLDVRRTTVYFINQGDTIKVHCGDTKKSQ